jgi:hypothetical protein
MFGAAKENVPKNKNSTTGMKHILFFIVCSFPFDPA